MKNLVFPRIFLHCVALGFIVSGLLLSEGSDVRIVSGVPLRNDLWMSGRRASAPASTAKVFLRSTSQPLRLAAMLFFYEKTAGSYPAVLHNIGFSAKAILT